jgi:hypothetical protein
MNGTSEMRGNWGTGTHFQGLGGLTRNEVPPPTEVNVWLQKKGSDPFFQRRSPRGQRGTTGIETRDGRSRS